MPQRNSKTNSSPVTRPLHGARISSKALANSARTKSAPRISNSTIIPSPAKPARGSKGTTHIVSFAEAKRSNEQSKSAVSSRFHAAPNHASNAKAPYVKGSSAAGRQAAAPSHAAQAEHRGAHASRDFEKQGKAANQGKGVKSIKKKIKLPENPFRKKSDKEFVIPAGKDMTTASSNIFNNMLSHLSEDGENWSKNLSRDNDQLLQEKSRKKASDAQKPSSRRSLDSKAESAVYTAEPEKSEAKGKSGKSRLTSFLGNKREKSAEKKRRKAKAKANRKFDKAYGGAENASSAQSGPRAAVYAAKMGTKHKKSAKMQVKEAKDMATRSASFVSNKLATAAIPKFVSRSIITLMVCAIFGFGLYGPAQQYYVQMRETDRLQAEFIEVAERTNNLADSIESLQTQEGIEDKAHADLGYVKSGEKTATVKGIASINLLDLPTSNVAPGSIPAPDTWYSGVLDVIFDYSG